MSSSCVEVGFDVVKEVFGAMGGECFVLVLMKGADPGFQFNDLVGRLGGL